MKPLTLIIEEQHLLKEPKQRLDIGGAVLPALLATCAKRNIRIVISNQLFSSLDAGIIGNLSCRLITRMTNPRCISVAKESLGLSWPQAEKIPELEKREIIVQYAGYPKPFLVRVDEISFPPKPSELHLERAAQYFLAQVNWSEDSGEMSRATNQEVIQGDSLKVFIRIAEVAETIEDRCQALQMDRAREVRARRILEAKGYTAEDEITLGNKMKIYRVTPKGAVLAKKMGIKVKRFKSGTAHEYLLNQVEKKIGLLSTQYKFQRNSEIAREHGIQPDSVLNLTHGYRVIIEIVCTNVNYEAEILNKERAIPGVDKIIAVAANKKVKKALERALENNLYEERGDNKPARLVVLDGGECLGERFDWIAIFEGP